ncbi:transmembrane protein 222-like [Ruditapes philippinarum]|uniref:transmembrane protein 222-like n=1 Tax=Ruditapes philippinarum TaxID=129788 RepID=UPI00295ACEF2|nr:transmembrane protein 222-like [Ruditapes philippinarum]
MEVNPEIGSEKRPIKMPLPLYDAQGIDHKRQRYPNCIVWTPIPCLTWLLPMIGHMGIATTAGVIRDFAGPYYVSEDEMAFGRPTKYWQLDIDKVGKKGQSQKDTWDLAVYDASEEYKTRMHNLCCDNCHSHCAMALNIMEYGGSKSWNMVKLCFYMLIFGKYVSVCGFIKTWLPFLIMAGGIIALAVTLS